MSLSTAYNLNKANSNSFCLILPNIPNYGSSEPLLLNVHGTPLPSIDFAPKDIRFQGGKMHIPGAEITFAPLNVSFMVDEHFENWKTIFQWLMFMHNNKDKYVEGESSRYAIDGAFLLLDNWKKTILELKLVNVFPVSLGECPVSFREGNRYVETNATFSYDYFSIVEQN